MSFLGSLSLVQASSSTAQVKPISLGLNSKSPLEGTYYPRRGCNHWAKLEANPSNPHFNPRWSSSACAEIGFATGLNPRQFWNIHTYSTVRYSTTCIVYVYKYYFQSYNNHLLSCTLSVLMIIFTHTRVIGPAERKFVHKYFSYLNSR